MHRLLFSHEKVIRDRFTTEGYCAHRPSVEASRCKISNLSTQGSEAEPLTVLQFEDVYAVITTPH